jgi:hypothetical protein
VGARLREYRCDAQAAADTNHLSAVADVAWNAHRPGNAVKFCARQAVLLHLTRGLSNRLNHERNGSSLLIEIGNGQRYALAVFMGNDDNELARPGGPGHQWMMDFQQISRIREILPSNYFKHRTSTVITRLPAARAAWILAEQGALKRPLNRCKQHCKDHICAFIRIDICSLKYTLTQIYALFSKRFCDTVPHSARLTRLDLTPLIQICRKYNRSDTLVVGSIHILNFKPASIVGM